MLHLSLLVLGMTALSGKGELPPVSGLDGRAHRPIAEAAGKPVAAIFISHDCPICNALAPEIARIVKAYRSRVEIDVFYAEHNIKPAEARTHAKSFGLEQAKIFLDPSGVFASACSATITPEAAVFDSKGVRVYVGRINDLFYSLGGQRPKASVHDLRAALDAVLAHKPVKPAAGPAVGCVIETSKLP